MNVRARIPLGGTTLVSLILFSSLIAAVCLLINPPVVQSQRRGVENPGALDSFFKALDDTKRGERIEPVRIIHYGDSHTAADILTAAIRNKLQFDFGNGGAGYLIARNPMTTTRKGVASGATSGWTLDGIGKGTGNDGFYGLAGLSLTTNKANERLWIETSCNSFDIYYLRFPGGGTIDITVDGVSVLDEPLSLDSELPGPDYFTHSMVAETNHRIEVRTLTPGRTRILGIVAENITPHAGISYDVMGINGARLDRIFNWNLNLFVDNLVQRNPNLIILAYGTNEVTDGDWSIQSYAQKLTAVVQRFRRAVPNASILILGPPDRADTPVATRKLPQLIEAQRRAAKTAGAAYWCAYDAMGGAGSMQNWVKLGLGQVDHVHLTKPGYSKLAEMFYADLMKAYQNSKTAETQRHAQR
jgi:lysophospholipase L1-like esterase